MFKLIIKTEKSVSEGKTYAEAIKHGTKREMLAGMEQVKNIDGTIYAAIKRDKDGEIVAEWGKDA